MDQTFFIEVLLFILTLPPLDASHVDINAILLELSAFRREVREMADMSSQRACFIPVPMPMSHPQVLW